VLIIRRSCAIVVPYDGANHRLVSTVKPVKQGHPWDVPKVSLIERCSHFTGQFALRTAVWDQMRCPYFTGCPHFVGLLFTGFTVVTLPLRESVI
jgi:hypothetical protein